MFVLMVTMLAFNGCKKNDVNKNEMLIAKAKQYFLENYKKPTIFKEDNTTVTSFDNATPNWENAYVGDVLEKENVVIVPLVYSEEFIERQGSNLDISLEDAAKLCFFEMTSNTFDMEQVTTLPMDKTTANSVTTKDLIIKKNIVSNIEEAYIKTGELIKNADLSRGIDPMASSNSSCQLWGHFNKYSDGTIELMYTYWVCELGSDVGGGGGATGQNLAQEKLDELAANGYATSEISSQSELTNNGTEREVEYEWIAFRNLSWVLFSYEQGVHELDPNPPNQFTKWKWKSLTHKSEGGVGTIVGGSIDYSFKGVTATTLGTYFSTIGIRYEIKYSLVWSGSPFSQSHIYKSQSPLYNCNP